HYRPDELDLANGLATDGASEMRFSGNYKHPLDSLKTGDLSFDVTARNIVPSRIEHLARISSSLDAVLAGTLRGTGHMTNGNFELTAANVNLTGQRVTVYGEPIGDLVLTAETKGVEMTAR